MRDTKDRVLSLKKAVDSGSMDQISEQVSIVYALREEEKGAKEIVEKMVQSMGWDVENGFVLSVTTSLVYQAINWALKNIDNQKPLTAAHTDHQKPLTVPHTDNQNSHKKTLQIAIECYDAILQFVDKVKTYSKEQIDDHLQNLEHCFARHTSYSTDSVKYIQLLREAIQQDFLDSIEQMQRTVELVNSVVHKPRFVQYTSQGFEIQKQPEKYCTNNNAHKVQLGDGTRVSVITRSKSIEESIGLKFGSSVRNNKKKRYTIVGVEETNKFLVLIGEDSAPCYYINAKNKKDLEMFGFLFEEKEDCQKVNKSQNSNNNIQEALLLNSGVYTLVTRNEELQESIGIRYGDLVRDKNQNVCTVIATSFNNGNLVLFSEQEKTFMVDAQDVDGLQKLGYSTLIGLK